MTRPIDRTALLLATGLGVGWVPVIPGTFGSLWGLAIAGGLHWVGWSWQSRLLILIVLCLVGVWICTRAAAVMNRNDPGPVVFDEFACLPLAYLFVPFDLTTALIGFLLFRVLDIAKPWPIRRFEQLPGGWGIMADDVAAGLLTGGLLWLGLKALGQ